MSRKITPEERQQYKEKLRSYKDALKNGEWQLKPFNEFLSLVAQKEDIELHPDHPFCPFCHSERLNDLGTSSTCVGSFGEFDCNHHWRKLSCQNCDQSFTMEYKGHGEALPRGRYNVWYTKEGRVVRGIPTCFEAYIFDCVHCGGDVHRHYYNPGTRDTDSLLHHIEGKLVQEIWYSCDSCKAEVKCSNDCFLWNSPHKPRKPTRPIHRLRLKWKIYEEVGIVIVNDYAITQIGL